MKNLKCFKLVKSKKLFVTLAFALVLTFSFAYVSVPDVNAASKKNTFVKTAKGYTYLNAKGKKVKGLNKIKGKYYYFNKKGVMQSGAQKVDGMMYFFKKNSKGLAPAITSKSKKVSGKKYYFTDKGYGFISTGTTDGDEAVTAVLAKTKLTKSMSDQDRFKACYKTIVSKYNYLGLASPDLDTDWISASAKALTDAGAGKCYNFAAITYLTAKAFGISGKVVSGTVTTAEGMTPREHAWVEIDKLIYDAQFEQRYTKGSPLSFFGMSYTEAYNDYVYAVTETYK